MLTRSSQSIPRLLSRLLPAILLALAGLLVAGLGLLGSMPEGRAQGDIQVVKRLGRSSPVVRVGELLTFTIYITNRSGFTLTTAPMTDVYRADILAYAFSQPFAPDEGAIIMPTGLLTWNNIADPAMFGPIPDGRGVSFTIGFTATTPGTAIVNAAGVHDAQDEGGQFVGDGRAEASNEVVGGAAPVEKRIEPPGYTPLAGTALTFTTRVTNDGAAPLEALVLVDHYDPEALAFNYALPTPTLVLTPTGVLSWDLVAIYGPIPGDTVLTITSVFTALPGIGLIDTANQVEVAHVLDMYSNTLAAGADQVPITIIGAETPTATPSPDDDDEDEEDEATPTPTPTATSVPTPTATPIPLPTPTQTTPFPEVLPETGRSKIPGGAAPLVVGAVLLLAALLSRR